MRCRRFERLVPAPCNRLRSTVCRWSPTLAAPKLPRITTDPDHPCAALDKRPAPRRTTMKKIASASTRPAPFDLDIDKLLHPAMAFQHPRRVLEDPDLTLNEKRAILASWASDACAI